MRTFSGLVYTGRLKPEGEKKRRKKGENPEFGKKTPSRNLARHIRGLRYHKGVRDAMSADHSAIGKKDGVRHRMRMASTTEKEKSMILKSL